MPLPKRQTVSAAAPRQSNTDESEPNYAAVATPARRKHFPQRIRNRPADFRAQISWARMGSEMEIMRQVAAFSAELRRKLGLQT